MAQHAHYRKINDGSHCSSTYHKKDCTSRRAKIKAGEVDSVPPHIVDNLCIYCNELLEECNCLYGGPR